MRCHTDNENLAVALSGAELQWTGAQRELIALHASILYSCYPEGVAFKRKRSLKVFQRYRKMSFRNYLGAFDVYSGYLAEYRKGNRALTDVLTAIHRDDELFSLELERVIASTRSEVKAYRFLATLIEFPLRFDAEGAEENYERLLEVNRSRPSFRPSARLKQLARSIVDDPSFREVVETSFFPHHGPGSVVYESDSVYRLSGGKVVEWHLLSCRTGRLTHAEKDQFLDCASLLGRCEASGWELDDGPWTLLSDDRSPPLPSAARVISVPKNWKKKRLIAMEDVTLQYYEQGVRHALYRGLEAHPILSRMIDLEHPEKNAELAELGSLTADYATIDLSDASDSVGYHFVRRLFVEDDERDDANWFWHRIHLARSTHFQVAGSDAVHESRIFATMGNAICFPIECLVFALIALEAHSLNGTSVEDACRKIRVYGDDIVTSEEVVPTLLELLRKYGFKPNDEKSFYGFAGFRESCGGEYLRGEDVTPCRIARNFRGTPSTLNDPQWAAMYDLANRFQTFDLKAARRNVIAKITNGFTRIPAVSTDGSFGLIVEDPRSFYEEGEYERAHSPFLHSGYTVVEILKARTRRRFRDQKIALAEWLNAARFRDDDVVETSTTQRVIGYRKVKRAHLDSSGVCVGLESVGGR